MKRWEKILWIVAGFFAAIFLGVSLQEKTHAIEFIGQRSISVSDVDFRTTPLLSVGTNYKSSDYSRELIFRMPCTGTGSCTDSAGFGMSGESIAYSSYYDVGVEWTQYITIFALGEADSIIPTCGIASADGNQMKINTCEVVSDTTSPQEIRQAANGVNVYVDGYTRMITFRIKGEFLAKNEDANRLNFRGSLVRIRRNTINGTGQNSSPLTFVWSDLSVEMKAKTAAEAIEEGSKQEQDRYEEENKAAEDATSSDNAPNTEAVSGGLNNFFGVFEQIKNAAVSGACTLPDIEAYGFKLGDLNLCQYSPPEWVRIVGGGVCVLALAWCGFRLFGRVIEVAVGGLV